ncbi:MAG TPA: hypothetical protein VIT38_07915 [Allosphingosinicella sp.]
MALRDEGRPFWRGREDRETEREMTVGELIDRVTGRIVTGLVIAAAMIGLAVYARPSPPHYDAVVAPDGKVVRINTESGAMLVCDGGYCQSILRPGQRLDRAPTTRPERPAVAPSAAPGPALGPPAAATAPALPPPATNAPTTAPAQTAPAPLPAR